MSKTKLFNFIKGFCGILFAWFIIVTGTLLLPQMDKLTYPPYTWLYAISILASAIYVVFKTIEGEK